MRKFLICVAAVLAPSLAVADPSIEIKDRGDYTEVIAHGVMSKRTAISPIRQRLEVPLAGVVAVKRVTPAGDPTVQLAEVDNESHVLSVKLTMQRDDVRTLAKSAQAMQIGDDLHLMFPKKIPADGAVVKLPEPTLPAAIVAPVVAPVVIAPVIAPAAKTKTETNAKTTTEIDDEQDKIEMSGSGSGSGSASKEVGATTKVAPLGKVDPVPAKTVAMAEEPGGQAMTYGALALAVIGSIFWMVKRRKAGATASASTIDVIAQRSLGGKAKIVWLSAGGRDMVVAVTAQNVRMLGQWPRGENKGGFGTLGRREPESRDAREPRFAEGTQPGVLADADVDAPAPLALTPASPAIQGLMRLRKRGPQPPPAPGSFVRQKRDSFAALQVNEEVATDDIDADALWAKEILAATNGRSR